MLSNHGFVLSKRGMHHEASCGISKKATRLNKSLYRAHHPKVVMNLENLGFTMAMVRLRRSDRGKKKNKILLDRLVPTPMWWCVNFGDSFDLRKKLSIIALYLFMLVHYV
jgi:hypothetical protein